MAKRLLPGTIAVLFLLVPTSALAGGGEINLFLGEKSLDSEWEPWDSQDEIGLQLTFGHDWPVAIAVDYMVADDSSEYSFDYYGYSYSYKVKVETTELALGVRKFFREEKKVQPYIEGGLDLVDGELEIVGLGKLSDDASGYWIGGGVMFRIRRFNLGIDLRSSSADIKFSIPGGSSTPKFDAGGTHIGVLLGFRWGH